MRDSDDDERAFLYLFFWLIVASFSTVIAIALAVAAWWVWHNV